MTLSLPSHAPGAGLPAGAVPSPALLVSPARADWPRWAGVAVLAGALWLAACGGGGGDAAPQPAGAGTTAVDVSSGATASGAADAGAAAINLAEGAVAPAAADSLADPEGQPLLAGAGADTPAAPARTTVAAAVQATPGQPPWTADQLPPEGMPPVIVLAAAAVAGTDAADPAR